MLHFASLAGEKVGATVATTSAPRPLMQAPAPAPAVRDLTMKSSDGQISAPAPPDSPDSPEDEDERAHMAGNAMAL